MFSSFGREHGGQPGQEVCGFFAKAGWCKFADTCRFAHIGGGQAAGPQDPFAPPPWRVPGGAPARSAAPQGMIRPTSFAAAEPPRAPAGEPGVCRFFTQPGGCKHGELCPFIHDGDPGEPALCEFFQKTGWCKWGDACKYIHAGGPSEPIGQSGEVCQFFQKSGWCKFGPSCRFAHTGGPPPEGRAPLIPNGLNGQSALGSEVCKFFAKANWCKWGDACRYLHVQGGPEDQQFQPSPELLSEIGAAVEAALVS